MNISKVGSSEKCVGYNGIAHPKTPTKCCASTCGDLCGALNCDEADGGANACCGSGIQDNVICGLNGQKAPCSIGTCFHLSQTEYSTKYFTKYLEYIES